MLTYSDIDIDISMDIDIDIGTYVRTYMCLHLLTQKMLAVGFGSAVFLYRCRVWVCVDFRVKGLSTIGLVPKDLLYGLVETPR